MTKSEYWLKYDSKTLCIQFTDDFDIWWDPNRFSWYYCNYLYSRLSNKIDIWWDNDKVNIIHWKKYSRTLCRYAPHKFDYWWDPKKFNWYDSNYLVKYLLNKINTWYISSIIDIEKLKKSINKLEWRY